METAICRCGYKISSFLNSNWRWSTLRDNSIHLDLSFDVCLHFWICFQSLLPWNCSVPVEEILGSLVFLVYLRAELVTGAHLCLWKAPVCHIAVIFSICMSSVALGFLVWTQSSACPFIRLLCDTFLLFLFKCCVSLSFFLSSLPLLLSLSLSPFFLVCPHRVPFFSWPLISCCLIVSIKCSLLTWGESRLPLIPSLCEYLAFFYSTSSTAFCRYPVSFSRERGQ